jgi:hypothetical protein
MGKVTISDNPEHIERVLIRPLVENFCYNYMYQNNLENFTIKMVEYIKDSQAGKADVYFSVKDGTYSHIVLKIPIVKRHINGKIQVTVDDPIIEILNKDNPRIKKRF